MTELSTLALPDLARLVNHAHHAAAASAAQALEYARAAGEYLTLAKAACQHGQWLPWLSENFEGSESTAQRYMQVHAHWDRLMENPARVRDLSLRAALAEITGPREPKPEPVLRIEAAIDRSAAHLKRELAATGGWVDDGTGEMVQLDALPPEEQDAVLSTVLVEETYERRMRQGVHIAETYERKDASGHLTPEARAEREALAAAGKACPECGYSLVQS